MTPETARSHSRVLITLTRALGAAVVALPCAAAVAHADTGGAATPVASPPAGAPAPAVDAPSPTSDAKSAPIRTTEAQTRRLQRRLRVTVDGRFGARSASALRRWEARNGLAADGRPDRRVLSRMRIALTAGQRAATDRRSSTPAPAAAPDGAVARAIPAALSRVGDPYAHGGAAPGGFDCSGLIVWAFRQAGIRVPRTSFEQARIGTTVARDQIQAGDLVFFSTAGPGASDVGLAVDGRNVVSATTRGVKVHPTFDEYWGSQYVTARRVR